MAKQTFTTGSVLTATQMNNLQANDYNWTVSQKTANYVLVAADAGTRVEMNTASNTTVTVNTGLFTAGDTLFIQNIGAGSCVITAGTATVQKSANASLTLSQYQGGYLYFVSTSNAVFFADAGFTSPLTTKGDLFTWDTGNARLAVGTNGQVLTADSTAATGLKWGAAASGKNFSLLGTGTTTSGSTVTVSGISGQDQLFVVVDNVSAAAANTAILLRFNTDSGSNYAWYAISNDVGASYVAGNYGSSGLTGRSSVTVGAMGSNAASTVNGYAFITGAGTSGLKMFQVAGSPDGTYSAGTQRWSGGYWNGSAITSISLVANASTFDAGEFRVYGSA